MFPSIQQPSAGVGLAGDPSSTSADTITPVSHSFHLEMKRALAASPRQANPDQANTSLTPPPQEAATGTGAANPGQKVRDTDSGEPRKHASESRASASADSDPAPVLPVDPLQLLASAVVPFNPIPTSAQSQLPEGGSASPAGQGIPQTAMAQPGVTEQNGPVPQSATAPATGNKPLGKATPARETAIEQKTAKPSDELTSPLRPEAEVSPPATDSATTPSEPGLVTGNPTAVNDVAPNAKPPDAAVQAGLAPPQAKANSPVADMTRRIPAAPAISPPVNPSVEAKAGSPSAEVSQPLGISAAQQESSMKKAENGPKTAELAQQNLPSGGALTTAHEQARPAGEAQPVVSALNNSSSADEARQLSLERTHDLVATHSLRLSQSGNDSLRVVIEPGSGTRLSLELRLNNGEVEVQAQLHRGDFEFLSHHWAELQQRLEPRGVHLAALENPSDSFTGQPNSEQRGRQPAEEQPTRSAFAEFAFDDSMVESPGKRRGRAKKYAGWESWA